MRWGTTFGPGQSIPSLCRSRSIADLTGGGAGTALATYSMHASLGTGMMFSNHRVGLAVALAAAIAATPLWAQTPTAGDTASPAGLSYPMSFDTVETYLMSVVPPDGRDDVRGITLSQADNGLRVAGEVRIGAIPGFELLGGLGWAKVTATGPVSIVRPGVLGWEIKTMVLGETPMLQSVWGPLIRRMTRREDTIIPFRVATWVSRVEVQPDQLMLHARGH